jgi:predicted DNA-binding protein YlxM (UPF0122 family)
MKIYEALAEVKTLKERLVQLSNFRQSSMIYDADSEPDFNNDELSQQIDTALERITELKLAIQAANLANTVMVGSQKMTLARAILELSNLRTKLTYIASMLNLEKSDIFGRVRRTKEDVVQKWQKSPAELLQLQGEYQKRKNLIDAAIQEANHRVTITD